MELRRASFDCMNMTPARGQERAGRGTVGSWLFAQKIRKKHWEQVAQIMKAGPVANTRCPVVCRAAGAGITG